MIVEELAAKFGLEVDEAAFDKVEAALHGLHHGVMGLVGVFGAAVVAVGAIVESVGEAGDHAARTAEKIGITTQALQGLEYAAHLSDVAAESLQSGLKFLGKNAAAAAQGSTEMQEAFARAGVSIHGADGKIRPIQDLLLSLSNHFQKMPAGAEKTKLAMDLLGRGGIDMIPFLNKGGVAITELTKKAKEMGLIMDAQTIKDAEEYADGMKEVGGALTGLKNAIGGPLLKDAARVSRFISEWIIKNRVLIATPIVKFAKALGSVISFLANGTKEASAVWFVFVTFLATKGVMALLAMTAGMEAFTLASIHAAIASASVWLGAILPIAALAALIVLIVDELYEFATGGDTVLGDMIAWFDKVDPDNNNLIMAIKKAGKALFDLGHQHALENLFEGIGEANAEAIKGLGGLFARYFMDAIRIQILQLYNLLPAPVQGLLGQWMRPDKAQYTGDNPEAIGNVFAGGGIHGATFKPSVNRAPQYTGDNPETIGNVFAGGGIHAVVNIDARGNDNHQAIAHSVAEQIEAIHKRHMAEAKAALQGF